MIHYQLRCSQDHEFDGWFKDSSAFDRQAEHGLVECPVCGDTKVTRALMAPAVSTREATPPPAPPAKQAPQPSPTQNGPPPAQLLALLQRMRAEVEKNCDYVGPEFAEEARRIHRGEADQRGIYGETTRDEAEALADEGIAVTSGPWVPRADG
jgi:hypothetical protein